MASSILRGLVTNDGNDRLRNGNELRRVLPSCLNGSAPGFNKVRVKSANPCKKFTDYRPIFIQERVLIGRVVALLETA